MFEVTKQFRFEAAHRLPDHDGKCARLHGHSFVMTVLMSGPSLVAEGPKRGMLIDFGTVKEHVQPIVDERLDHYYLNESTGLENPTSEALARYLYHAIRAALPPELRLLLWAVRIEETCTSAATFNGDVEWSAR